MPQETATLIPAHPLADHPFSAAKIPPRNGHVRIFDSHGGSHDLPVENIAAAQKIDPDLRLDISNIEGFRSIGRLQRASETQHAPPKQRSATHPHADPQNRSSITVEPNAQSPQAPIIDKPAGTVTLPPLPNVSEA